MPLTTAPSLVIMSLGSPEVNALMNMRMVLMTMMMFDFLGGSWGLYMYMLNFSTAEGIDPEFKLGVVFILQTVR